MRRRDYALYLIKPDGVRAGIRDVIHTHASENGYLIEAEIQCSLHRQDVFNLFNVDFDKQQYEQYMISGPVIAGVCSGIDAFEWLTNLKHIIRTEYGKQNQMCNLIHTSEPGLEQMRQMSFFFPEWCHLGWTPTADMYIPVKRDDFLQKLEYVATQTNLEYAGFVVTEQIPNYENLKFPNINILYGIQLEAQYMSQTLPLLAYFRHVEHATSALTLKKHGITEIIRYVHMHRGFVVAGYFPFDIFSHKLLPNEDLDGIYLFDPRYTYDELNTVEFWSVVKGKMNAIGGSCGVVPPGTFGIPASSVIRILNSI